MVRSQSLIWKDHCHWHGKTTVIDMVRSQLLAWKDHCHWDGKITVIDIERPPLLTWKDHCHWHGRTNVIDIERPLSLTWKDHWHWHEKTTVIDMERQLSLTWKDQSLPWWLLFAFHLVSFTDKWEYFTLGCTFCVLCWTVCSKCTFWFSTDGCFSWIWDQFIISLDIVTIYKPFTSHNSPSSSHSSRLSWLLGIASELGIVFTCKQFI